MKKTERDELIRLTIKMYPHKHGDELAMEMIECLDRADITPEQDAPKVFIEDAQPLTTEGIKKIIQNSDEQQIKKELEKDYEKK